VKKKIEESRLESVVGHLTTDIVLEARARNLMLVGEQLRRQMRVSIVDQQ
jgi:hypothetical protein